MGEFFQKAFAQRITNSVRVAWIAAIVFLFPMMAFGNSKASTIAISQRTSVFEKCRSDQSFASKLQSQDESEKKKAQDQKADWATCSEALSFAQTKDAEITAAEANAGKIAEGIGKDASSTDITKMFEACQEMSSTESGKSMQTGGATEQAAQKMMELANKFKSDSTVHGKDPKQAAMDIANAFRQDTVNHMQVAGKLGSYSATCNDAKKRQDSNLKKAAEAKEAMAANQQMMQMGQMGLGAIGQAMDLMAKGKSSGAAAGGPTSLDAGPGGLGDVGNGLNLGDTGFSAGGVDANGDGIPDSQQKNGIDIAGPEIGNGIGLSVGGDPAAAPATGAAPTSSGGAYVPSALSDSSLAMSSPASEGSGGGRGPASNSGGGSGGGGNSLGGGKSAAATEETAAANSGASKEGDGSDRAGGGKGLAGGVGGGSSLLGLGGDSGLDLLSGFKNPLEAGADAAGDGSLRLGGGGTEPPAADPRRLASAVEIDTRTMDKDSVFSVVKNAIQRQRERGNTR